MTNKGITERVRKAARKLKAFSVSDLAHVDYDIFISKNQVEKIIFKMRESGEVERLSLGCYRYNFGKRIRSHEVRDRIYRAMHVKGSFSAREIAVLSDADISYIMELIRKLLKDEVLEKAGTGRSPKGREERRLRVKHRDGFYRKFVKPVSSKE